MSRSLPDASNYRLMLLQALVNFSELRGQLLTPSTFTLLALAHDDHSWHLYLLDAMLQMGVTPDANLCALLLSKQLSNEQTLLVLRKLMKAGQLSAGRMVYVALGCPAGVFCKSFYSDGSGVLVPRHFRRLPRAVSPGPDTDLALAVWGLARESDVPMKSLAQLRDVLALCLWRAAQRAEEPDELLQVFDELEAVHPMWGWLRLRQESHGDALENLDFAMGAAAAASLNTASEADDVDGPYLPRYTDMGRAHAAFRRFSLPAGYSTRDVDEREMLATVLQGYREANGMKPGAGGRRRERRMGGRGLKRTRGSGKGFGARGQGGE